VPLGPVRLDPTGADDAPDTAESGPLGAARSHRTVSAGARGSRRPDRGRSRVVALAAGALVLVVGAAVALDGGPGSSGGPADRAADDPGDGAPGAPATLAVEDNDADPNRAIARAALTLQEAGSFAYRGEARADVPTAARPGPALMGTVTIEGQVGLPNRARETAVAGTTVVETLISGRGVWWRQAASREALADASWSSAQETSFGAGLISLHDWLHATVDRNAGPVDDEGRRTYTGLFPPEDARWLMGDAADATAALTLTVDGTGEPVRVVVAAAAGASRFALRIDIVDLGAPVDIAPPGGRELGITPAFATDELLAAGVHAPVQLHELPSGWILSDASLSAPTPDVPCGELSLGYVDVASQDRVVWLTVADVDCVRPPGPFAAPLVPPEPEGGDMVGDGWTVLGSHEDSDGSAMSVGDGVTQVGAFSTLPLAELRAILASLGPYDRLDQPSLTAGP
jgi:hypothetical protein